MARARVLMVLTSHDVIGVSGKKTGNWFDEVATPWYKFKEAGFDLTLATPKGGAAPIDPFSYDDLFMTENSRRFVDDPAPQRSLANTLKFSEIDVDDYAGVFFPGGYGQIWDLAGELEGHSLDRKLDREKDAGRDGLPFAGDPQRRQETERRTVGQRPGRHRLHRRGRRRARSFATPAFFIGTCADPEWRELQAVQSELGRQRGPGRGADDRSESGFRCAPRRRFGCAPR